MGSRADIHASSKPIYSQYIGAWTSQSQPLTKLDAMGPAECALHPATMCQQHTCCHLVCNTLPADTPQLTLCNAVLAATQCYQHCMLPPSCDHTATDKCNMMDLQRELNVSEAHGSDKHTAKWREAAQRVSHSLAVALSMQALQDRQKREKRLRGPGPSSLAQAVSIISGTECCSKEDR
jgi:hypothetical protein